MRSMAVDGWLSMVPAAIASQQMTGCSLDIAGCP
jgi:hypothetical protein